VFGQAGLQLHRERERAGLRPGESGSLTLAVQISFPSRCSASALGRLNAAKSGDTRANPWHVGCDPEAERGARRGLCLR